MLADDEILVAMAVEEILTEAGYRVTVASDGTKALAAYMADPADLLITDVRMPELDGFSLMWRLRGMNPTLPVIIMSGHLLSSMMVTDQSRGKTTVFEKPVRLDQLLNAVRASFPTSQAGR
nr:response regulator [Azospirillum sp. SYSU D00513]